MTTLIEETSGYKILERCGLRMVKPFGIVQFDGVKFQKDEWVKFEGRKVLCYRRWKFSKKPHRISEGSHFEIWEVEIKNDPIYEEIKIRLLHEDTVKRR